VTPYPDPSLAGGRHDHLRALVADTRQGARRGNTWRRLARPWIAPDARDALSAGQHGLQPSCQRPSPYAHRTKCQRCSISRPTRLQPSPYPNLQAEPSSTQVQPAAVTSDLIPSDPILQVSKCRRPSVQRQRTRSAATRAMPRTHARCAPRAGLARDTMGSCGWSGRRRTRGPRTTLVRVVRLETVGLKSKILCMQRPFSMDSRALNAVRCRPPDRAGAGCGLRLGRGGVRPSGAPARPPPL
jgi:hypothetical protein